MSDKLLVHIVDENAADRAIGEAILHDHGFKTRTWPSPAGFLAAIAVAEAGCVLIDFGANGDAESAMSLLAARPRVFPTIVLGRHEDIALAIDVMKAGAVDFLEKPLVPHLAVAAVERAYRYLIDKRHRDAAVQNAERLIGLLSPRERNVLHNLIRGASNKSIARKLDISIRTVEVHRARIMAKLHATSLPMVMHVAYFAGLFLPEDEYIALLNAPDTTGSYV